MLYLPINIKRVEEIYIENPEIKNFAKYFNNADFTQLDFVIFSQPQTHPNHTVYGIWVLVIKNVLEDRTPKIKQDFIAFDRLNSSYVYYSGLGNNNLNSVHQSITNFCNKFGKHPDGTWGVVLVLF